VAGASTLATQIEKYRHAPEGLTESPRDKLLQMASASFRAYAGRRGDDGGPARIVLQYVNSVPLAAIRGEGEIAGIPDGLWAWYGTDPPRPRRRSSGFRPEGRTDPGARGNLARTVASRSQAGAGKRGVDPPASPDATRGIRLATGRATVRVTRWQHVARIYRQVLSLFLAQRRPSYYLATPGGQEALARLTDRYLERSRGRWDHRAGPGARRPRIRDRAPGSPPERPPVDFVERKAVNTVRTGLLGLLGVPRLYDLDRIDLSARTYHRRGGTGTGDPALSRPAGPLVHRGPGVRPVPAPGPGGSRRGDLLGVAPRTDTHGERGPDPGRQPGRPLQPERIGAPGAGVHREAPHPGQLPGDPGGAPRASSDPGSPIPFGRFPIASQDRLSAWTRDRVLALPGESTEDALRAAMNRVYSANPAERFVTGGGVQTFSNFDNTYDQQVSR
jgi:hypothetical protein